MNKTLPLFVIIELFTNASPKQINYQHLKEIFIVFMFPLTLNIKL